MSHIYRPDRPRGYLSRLVGCERCAELMEENHDLRVQVEALSVTLDVFRKAVLADYEWRGFHDAEEYLNELIIKQIKKEPDYGSEWPC